MVAGAVLMTISGADLDLALEMNEISNYLVTANQGRFWLITNLCVWIVGVILLGAAATSISKLPTKRPEISLLIRYCYSLAIPIVVIAYSAWLAVVVKLAPQTNPNTILVAETVGWFASRADWIATILVLAIGPVLISVAGRNEWVPNWLRVWSYLALFTGLLNAVAMFAGGLTTYGFLIIPVGMGWMFATSVVLFKRLKMIDKWENQAN
jgi:hypothetical protein